MPEARDLYGSVFEQSSAVLLARVTFADGQAVQQADLASGEYQVMELDPCKEGEGTVVSGHDGVSLTISDVVYDTLQTDAPWSVDSIGYNFRHEVDVGASHAFVNAGQEYQVRYTLNPTSGQPIVFRFLLRAI